MNREIYIRMAGVEDDHWWFSGRRAIVESLLARIGLPRDAAILEPGCGTGGNLRMLARCGSVCAMDLDDQACRFAQARGIGEVAAGRLPDKIPFGDRCFDLVVMTDVLEHLDDDAATLRALRERLKPGGLLLLTVPAFRFLWSSHDTSHHHRRRYRAEELRKVVSEAGYEICYLSYYNFLLFTPILATRMVQRLTGANREGHDLRLPPRPVNWLLRKTFAAERFIVGRVSLPVGVSLIVLARNVGPQVMRARDAAQAPASQDRALASA